MRYSISRQPPGALHLFSRFSPVCAVLFCTNRASEGFRPTGDGEPARRKNISIWKLPASREL
jgi:hypothetical protein